MSNELGIYPVGYRVLIEPDSGERVSDGGIVIPGQSRMEVDTGVIVAVGDYAWEDYETPWAEVGDRVMFAKYAGKFITDPATGREYKLLNDQDVNGIITTDAFSDNRNDQ